MTVYTARISPLKFYFSSLLSRLSYSTNFSMDLTQILNFITHQKYEIYEYNTRAINNLITLAAKKQLPKREDTLYLWP